MKINTYNPHDAIQLSVIAQSVVHEFKKLKRIGDTSTVEVWHSYIPESEVVPVFFPYLEKALANDGDKYGNCRVDIVHMSVNDSDEIDSIFATGLQLTLITEHQRRQVEEETKSRME